MAPGEDGGKVVKKRRARQADAQMIMEGMFELMRGTLSALLNEEQVDKAMAHAKKLPEVKRMMASVKAPKSKAAGGGGGPKAVRSAYQAFTTVAMAALKAADRADLANMTLVGQTWNKLPPNVKAKVEDRLNALKESYNAALEAEGVDVGSLVDFMKKADREAGADPIDYMGLIAKYKDYPTQPKAEATPKAALKKAPEPAAPEPKGEAKASGHKRKEEGGGGGGEEGHHKKKKEHKHKKEKKEKHKHSDD